MVILYQLRTRSNAMAAAGPRGFGRGQFAAHPGWQRVADCCRRSALAVKEAVSE